MYTFREARTYRLASANLTTARPIYYTTHAEIPVALVTPSHHRESPQTNAFPWIRHIRIVVVVVVAHANAMSWCRAPLWQRRMANGLARGGSIAMIAPSTAQESATTSVGASRYSIEHSFSLASARARVRNDGPSGRHIQQRLHSAADRSAGPPSGAVLRTARQLRSLGDAAAECKACHDGSAPCRIG